MSFARPHSKKISVTREQKRPNKYKNKRGNNQYTAVSRIIILQSVKARAYATIETLRYPKIGARVRTRKMFTRVAYPES